jgi:hypothetical protein
VRSESERAAATKAPAVIAGQETPEVDVSFLIGYEVTTEFLVSGVGNAA